MGSKKRQLLLSSKAEAALIESARSLDRVSGLTHTYYKYPARFSPGFARAAIEAFTDPGDVVIDNHVGGGTTLVEAIALGRHAIGVDISSLAHFVSRAKTVIYSGMELERIERWVQRVYTAINLAEPAQRLVGYDDYYKHLDHPGRWRLRHAIEQALSSARRLRSDRLEMFARCAILRAAQWALDGRREAPSIDDFRSALSDIATEMLTGAWDLAIAAARYDHRPRATVLHRSAAQLDTDGRLKKRQSPKLVLTSPPYPGIHVLYHRWQVGGGKEAPLPFMIANKLDGAGESYYTMGNRRHPGLDPYFENIGASMAAVAQLATRKTIVVQMLAFSEAEWQLPKYIETLSKAGLAEVFLPTLIGKGDGRLWRQVPNRRWYSHQQGDTPGSKEVVLIHRKS
ncbi:DNA methyltransferase [Enhydrobacter sp.]|jgi:hypothetical protein|uniref:DNA methyltransferase n=1 Tax=Enhydrobacter sp. TaxID=1894999 RepID=UPI002601B439|nr:DNA methyltransferase [Enhydrobacter sp.]WIM10144.1 MAG: hypothetical protein OJF58_001098 [Enhydrobacter sp.]